jgi:hypothetical protein
MDEIDDLGRQLLAIVMQDKSPVQEGCCWAERGAGVGEGMSPLVQVVNQEWKRLKSEITRDQVCV